MGLLCLGDVAPLWRSAAGAASGAGIGAGVVYRSGMENIVILAAVVFGLGLLLWPRVSGAPLWRATVTPLASIIGSGFLVLGPLLDRAYGAYAPIVMIVLCLGAYGFGAAVRYNIQWVEGQSSTGLTATLETASGFALGAAYMISVAYYLNLFGAFAVSLGDVAQVLQAKQVTSAVLVLILVVGWTRGFSALERMEQVAVSVKLAIILGLLVGLVFYFTDRTMAGGLVLNPVTVTGWSVITLGFGLIVTVQGFEISRYLGDSYDAALRIRSMKLAQILSAGIYVIYIVLLAYVFEAGTLGTSETAIVQMMQIVAPILPMLLIAAALSAQFSAAVADTAGSGGLLHGLSRGRISVRGVYAILVAVGLALTWQANIFEIISYASRAFAVYYLLQSMVAGVAAWPHQRRRSVGFFALAALAALIVLFGAAIE